MGLMQRRKGRAYEQRIAGQLRKLWPDAVVRRASQAERADNPDVFVEGGPDLLGDLWLELQDSKRPKPAEKLKQAERDVEVWHARRQSHPVPRLPVVIWHQTGQRHSNVTTRLWVLDNIRRRGKGIKCHQVVTMQLEAFLGLLGLLGGLLDGILEGAT